MKKVFFILFPFLFCCTMKGQVNERPPMGWNSFDSYGVYLDYEAADSLISVMADLYKPSGYEYFVIDAGWFGEFDLYPGTKLPKRKEPTSININEFGLLQPSLCYFPYGFRELIDKTHECGLKFGLHMMRGIPREAVRRNTIVKGTEYRAQDIVDTNSICKWSPQNYGIDMSKPGAQAYYDSVIQELAAWGVDFIKYDDIVPYPAEVAAVTEAIEKCGRNIILSLSPGVGINKDEMDIYRKSDMMRVTNDIWDVQSGIDVCFKAWKEWSDINKKNLFWIDMDMIPFGKLQIKSMSPETIARRFPEYASKMAETEKIRYSGKGYSRESNFNDHQKRTFITLRAMSASPLIIGGDLLTMDDFSYSLLTEPEMIACNQQGVMGNLVYEQGALEVWKSEHSDGNSGFIGIFNRSKDNIAVFKPSLSKLGLNKDLKYRFYNIWSHTNINNIKSPIFIQANDVVFIKYGKS